MIPREKNSLKIKLIFLVPYKENENEKNGVMGRHVHLQKNV